MKSFMTRDNQEFYLAPSYENLAIKVDEPFYNNKNKRYVRIQIPCDKCGDSSANNYDSLHGSCFFCLGSGIRSKTVRAYTEKEYNKIIKSKESKKKTTNPIAAKIAMAQKIGFGEDLKAYLVYGDNTYFIKDKLKEMGARFNPVLKWFFATKKDLPEGYFLCAIDFDDIYDYNPATNWAEFKENVKETINEKISKLKGPSISEFYPALEGTRLFNITAQVAKIHGFKSYYGYTYVYTFTSEDYVFIWMTTSKQSLNCGDLVDLTGTIKKFDEYLGVKNTHLSRCKITKINE